MADSPQGLLFDLDTFAVHDGPGIRMSLYLKGCPLRCAWCHSPESQSPRMELAFARERCLDCGACIAACPEGAQGHDAEGRRTIDRARCRTCGACVEVCPSGALTMKGYRVGADEIVRRAERLRPFFRHSGGGVTLTGGEAALQADFCAAVMSGCRELGIHTALETCGAVPWSRLERVVAQADLVLYDLKLYDDQAHRQWTGRDNTLILENARRLAGRYVQIRIPLIPGVTDTEGNLRGLFAFMEHAGLRRVALLRYNAAAGAKYEWLDRPYALGSEPQTPERLQELLALAMDFGLEAELG